MMMRNSKTLINMYLDTDLMVSQDLLDLIRLAHTGHTIGHMDHTNMIGSCSNRNNHNNNSKVQMANKHKLNLLDKKVVKINLKQKMLMVARKFNKAKVVPLQAGTKDITGKTGIKDRTDQMVAAVAINDLTADQQMARTNSSDPIIDLLGTTGEMARMATEEDMVLLKATSSSAMKQLRGIEGHLDRDLKAIINRDGMSLRDTEDPIGEGMMPIKDAMDLRGPKGIADPIDEGLMAIRGGMILKATVDRLDGDMMAIKDKIDLTDKVEKEVKEIDREDHMVVVDIIDKGKLKKVKMDSLNNNKANKKEKVMPWIHMMIKVKIKEDLIVLIGTDHI